MTDRALYEVWLENNPAIPELPWRAQLMSHVGQYPTSLAAERHIEQTKLHQQQWQTIADSWGNFER